MLLLLLTADHGEALGEDGLWWHGGDLHDPQTHVPLVVWGPGVVAGQDDQLVPASCVAETVRGEGCDLRTGAVEGEVVTGMEIGGEWMTRRPGTDTTTEED